MDVLRDRRLGGIQPHPQSTMSRLISRSVVIGTLKGFASPFGPPPTTSSPQGAKPAGSSREWLFLTFARV
jgi:hypothetical protein